MSYTAAPAILTPPDGPEFGTDSGGDEFRFYFVNGSILEGTTAGDGLVLLDGVDITNDVVILNGLTRNEITFDPAGPDPAFMLHLSCSDRFIGGWGQSAGPVEGVDVNWQIASYSIDRYNNNGFIKACGDTPVPFDVPNTASSAGTDSFGQDNDTSAPVSVEIVDPTLVFPENDAVSSKNRDVYFKFVSLNPEDLLITTIEVTWPQDVNGTLDRIQLGKSTIWTGSTEGDNPGSSSKFIIEDLDGSGGSSDEFTGQESDRILEALQKEKLRFTFKERPVADPASSVYVFYVEFDDGTQVAITTPPSPLLVDASDASAADLRRGGELTEATLEPVVQQAIAYWADQGVDADRVQDLQQTDVQIAALPGSILGTADDLTNAIRIDVDAAGFGWVTNGVDEKDPEINGVDLLSTVVHEFGHLLGYEHDFLNGTLQVGTRNLPLLPRAGDANRDGIFDRFDIIKTLQTGKYLTGERADWEDGDWNGDHLFDQRDLTAALQTGKYSQTGSEQAEVDDLFAQIGADDEDFGGTL